MSILQYLIFRSESTYIACSAIKKHIQAVSWSKSSNLRACNRKTKFAENSPGKAGISQAVESRVPRVVGKARGIEFVKRE